MLALQLRELERDSVIHHEVYKQVVGPSKSVILFNRVWKNVKDWGEMDRDRINKMETTRKAEEEI